MNDRFLPGYKGTIASCVSNDFKEDNYDIRRCGPYPKPSRGLKERLRNFAANTRWAAGFMKSYETRSETRKGLGFVKSHLEKLDWLYQHLSDDQSKQTLIQIIAYRALGYRRVKLPLNNPDYWAFVEAIERQMQGAQSIELGFLGWQAHKVNLAGFGYPVELFALPVGIMAQFILQQYRYPKTGGATEVLEGDTVLDAGGCYGDTALYFACKTSSQGRVYSFEFVPGNLEIYRRNLALNPDLAGRISLVERPLWSTSDERLFLLGSGPGTRVVPRSKDPKAKPVTTLAIDDFVRSEALSKVDFIKMDIEGAELEALRGAAETIRRFRPKLAIATYHRLSDFWTIPQYLDTLKLGYHFYLRHFTIHAEETVLFAEAT